ncbi:hypothetical protein [Allohahella marinimesophila]|uniref:Uncharacterized protein n=1 Tax=Allohahella marinimesophila TaxID=1054972 RepID=A0ABP7PV68_9GAMM
MLLTLNPEILLASFAVLVGLTYSTNSLLLNLIERKKAARSPDEDEASVDAADML